MIHLALIIIGLWITLWLVYFGGWAAFFGTVLIAGKMLPPEVKTPVVPDERPLYVDAYVPSASTLPEAISNFRNALTDE